MKTWHILRLLAILVVVVPFLILYRYIAYNSDATLVATSNNKLLSSKTLYSDTTSVANHREVNRIISKQPVFRNEDCGQLFQSRRYLTAQEQSLYTPALLYSFPGSGNTWARLLLDWATGIYTGSVYDDRTLLKILPGERHCDRSVSAIKAHPHIQTYDLLQAKSLPMKCSNNKIEQYNKAILLVRNPYDAIWSEFQRRYSGGSHVNKIAKARDGGIPKKVLEKWIKIRDYLVEKYLEMCSVDYAKFERQGATIVIKYEDLKDAAIRLQVLDNMIDFMGINDIVNSRPIYLAQSVTGSNNITERKLINFCAFVAAESPDAHRGSPSIPQKHHSQVKKRQPNYIQKSELYNKNTVCYMWKSIGQCASKYGYEPFNSYNCSS